MSSRKIKVEGVMELSQAVSYLEDVLNSLKEGILRLESGQEVMTLEPPSIVEFEMEVAQKKDKEKFELEISWKSGPKVKGAPDITISSK